MADNPFKRPDDSGFLDNDPFAELMRMAEAPREPSSRQEEPADESFDIDLERELLGDFDEPAVAPAQPSPAASWAPEPRETVAEPVPIAASEDSAEEPYDDLDLSFDLELDDEEPHLPLSAAEDTADELVAPAISFEDNADDVPDDLDLSFDLELEDEGPHLPLSAAEDTADELVAPAISFEDDANGVPDDFDARSHALFASVPETDEPVATEPDFEDFESAFNDFGAGDEQADFQPSAEAKVPQPSDPFVEPEVTDAFQDETPAVEFEPFDLELEEDEQPVSFDADVTDPVEPVDTFAHDDVLQAGPTDDYVEDDGLDAFSPGWNAADLQAEGPVEPVAIARQENAGWNPPELRRDVSDDDDVLGDIESWLNAEPELRSPVSPEAEPDDHETVVAAAPAEPYHSAPAEPQPLSLEDELGALLSDDTDVPSAPAYGSSEPSESAPYSEEGADDFDFSLDLELDDAGFEEEAAPQQATYGEAGSDPFHEVAYEPQAQPVAHASESFADEPAAPKKTGPLAMLAALAPAAMARFGGGDRMAAARTPEPVQPATPLFGMARTDRPVSPEIETVEVDEQPMALVDDLDIPELAEPEEITPLFSPDDLEAELDVAFGSLAPEEEPETASVHAAAASSGDTIPLQGTYNEGDYAYVSEPQFEQTQDDFGDVDFDYDPDAAPADAPPPKDGMRRKYFILGGIAAVALVGGFGYFLTGGPASDGLPAIVRADPEPVRVRPENRGGVVVPNQNSQAYQRATGATGAVGGGQEELRSSAEEPLDVRSAVAPQPADDFPMVGMDDIPMLSDSDTVAMLSSVKDEERLGGAAEAADEEGISIAPRRVRTMVVRPDGTMVARDELPAPSTREQLEAGAALDAGQVGGVPRVEDGATVASIVSQGEVLADDPITPETVNVVPSRPDAPGAGQAPVQLAAAQPATNAAPVAQSATPPAAGEWSMQIASQPSAEGAQSTYEDLARRYGSVLQGRGVNIVRAEIDGMGTFYRVRIPAETREEAVQLCTQYKAAGGSCFVSR
jgi:hypothetical protein